MKIFDSNNPKHFKILLEELRRAKSILREGSYYNEDDIWSAMTDKERKEAIEEAWSAMTDEERKEALRSVPNGAAASATYASQTDWNEIPDNIGDRIELSKYQLARDDRDMGRVMLRGIVAMKGEFRKEPEKAAAFDKLINRFCKDLGKTYDQLNVRDAIELNQRVAKLKNKFAPAPQMNARGNSGEDYGKGSRSWTGD